MRRYRHLDIGLRVPRIVIDFDQFLAVDMRVGRVTAVEDFPEARKPAWKLTIDFGPELGVKRSSAQITNYAREELEGRLVVAVVNFPPRQIGPVTSEVLCARRVRRGGQRDPARARRGRAARGADPLGRGVGRRGVAAGGGARRRRRSARRRRRTAAARGRRLAASPARRGVGAPAAARARRCAVALRDRLGGGGRGRRCRRAPACRSAARSGVAVGVGVGGRLGVAVGVRGRRPRPCSRPRRPCARRPCARPGAARLGRRLRREATATGAAAARRPRPASAPTGRPARPSALAARGSLTCWTSTAPAVTIAAAASPAAALDAIAPKPACSAAPAPRRPRRRRRRPRPPPRRGGRAERGRAASS